MDKERRGYSMARVHSVDILTVLFGIGTWICVNGLWVELPLLVQKLPEAWKLPSYLSVVIQLANIGPIIYTLLNSFFPKIVTEKRAIYLSMGVETVATLLLALFWTSESYIFGENRSVGLLVLGFFLALVDCSSRVLFLPFLTKFQPIYLMPYFIGEGLSSFIPSIFSLIQGVGGNPECRFENVTENGETVEKWIAVHGQPLFSVETFFILVFSIMILSMVAFHLLNFKSIVKNALSSPVSPLLSPARDSTGRRTSYTMYQSTSESPPNSLKSFKGELETEVPGKDSKTLSDLGRRPESRDEATATIATTKNTNNNLIVDVEPEVLFSRVAKPVFIKLIIVQSIICSLSNGVFPSIQSYSCLPYGNVAYHWAVVLSSMTNPIVCFLTMALPKPTQTSIFSVGVLSFGVAGYTFTTAIESPQPPLVGQLSGEVLLVISWILLVGLFTYVRVSVATILRAEGRRGLFICGAVTQIGSATGALVTFFIVNFTETFQSFAACQN